MSLAFLAKKSWHTANLRNVEKVWIAEQKHAAEQKKVEELRKNIEEERQLQELRQLQAANGNKAAAVERLDWMYQGPMAAEREKTAEEYLLGKEYKPEEGKTDLSKLGDSKYGALALNQAALPANDAFSRLHEDPMMVIRMHQKSAQESIMKNPVKMGKIKAKVEKILDDKKARKKAKKEAKRERKRSKREEKKKRKHVRDKSDFSDESDYEEKEHHHHRSQRAARSPSPRRSRSRDRSPRDDRHSRRRDDSRDRHERRIESRCEGERRGRRDSREDSRDRASRHRRGVSPEQSHLRRSRSRSRGRVSRDHRGEGEYEKDRKRAHDRMDGREREARSPGRKEREGRDSFGRDVGTAHRSDAGKKLSSGHVRSYSRSPDRSSHRGDRDQGRDRCAESRDKGRSHRHGHGARSRSRSPSSSRRGRSSRDYDSRRREDDSHASRRESDRRSTDRTKRRRVDDGGKYGLIHTAGAMESKDIDKTSLGPNAKYIANAREARRKEEEERLRKLAKSSSRPHENLSHEEKQRLAAQMLEDAKQREEYIAKRATQKKEALDEKEKELASQNPQFLKELHEKAYLGGDNTMSDRLRRNAHYIQRHADSSNFLSK